MGKPKQLTAEKFTVYETERDGTKCFSSTDMPEAVAYELHWHRIKKGKSSECYIEVASKKDYAVALLALDKFEHEFIEGAPKAKAEPKKVTNIFESAQTINVKTPAAQKAKGNGKEQVELESDLDTFAALSALEKTIESVKATIEPEIKGEMLDIFADMALSEEKPKSFKGVGAESFASCEIRKRSTASALKPEQIQFCEAHSIPLEDKVLSPAIPELWAINPSFIEKIMSDPKLAQKFNSKIEKIISDTPEFEGAPFLVKQEKQEPVIAKIVTENVLEDISKLKLDKEEMKQALTIASTLAIKPVLNDPTLDKVFALLKKAGINLK